MAGVLEVDEVVAHRGINGGGVFYRRDKYIRLTEAEWTKLFSADFDFDNPQPKILLEETDQNLLNKFVQVEFYNGIAYLDIRHWYFTNGEYFPSRMGVKLNEKQWNEFKTWNAATR